MSLKGSSENLTSNSIRYSIIAIGALLGLMGLSGWLFDSFTLRSFFSTGVTLKFNTAIFIVMFALGKMLLSLGRRHWGRLIITVAGVICLLSLYQHLFNADLGIDELFYKDSDQNYASDSPGRISLLTCIAGISLVISALLNSYHCFKSSQWIVFFGFSIAYTSLLGHIFGVEKLYYSHRYSGIACHTAIAFILFAFVILHSQIRQGYMRYYFRRRQSSTIAIGLLVYVLALGPLMVALYLKMISSSAMIPAFGAILSIVLVGCLALPATLIILKQIHKIEHELWKAKEKLEIALKAANLGSYEALIKDRRLIANKQHRLNFGIEHDNELNIDDFLNLITPEYKAGVDATLRQSFITGESYQSEYQIRRPDGKYSWIRSSGQPQLDNEGNVIGFVGITWQIKGQDAESKELERLYTQLKLSAEAGDIGLFDADLDTGAIDWNIRCRYHFGVKHDGPVSYERDFVAHVHPDDQSEEKKEFANALEKKNGEYNSVYRIIRPDDGQTRWIKSKGRVLFDRSGKAYRFIGVVSDVTREKEMEIRKNDFIGMASHELKTPVTSMKAYLQIMLSKARKENDLFSINALVKAERQVNKMSNMIKGFLDVERLESGKISLKRHTFFINDLIQDIVNDLEITLPSTHKLIFEEPVEYEVYADQEKIGHVLTNLINNAVKYSPGGELVTIKLNPNGSCVRISVIDEGIGLKKEDAEKLFNRFYRVENQMTANIAGFGIGLYLSAEIVKLHGTSIGINSQPGLGSEFSFELPVTGT